MQNFNPCPQKKKKCVLTVSQTTNFRLFQTEEFADETFKFDENYLKVENAVGKGEIACYKQFVLFPVFSNDLYCRHIKTRLFGKGLMTLNLVENVGK